MLGGATSSGWQQKGVARSGGSEKAYAEFGRANVFRRAKIGAPHGGTVQKGRRKFSAGRRNVKDASLSVLTHATRFERHLGVVKWDGRVAESNT